MLLFDTPPVFDLPLTKGQDLKVDFQQKVDGEYTAYDPAATVVLVIESDPDPDNWVTADATLDGFHAIVIVESEVADTIPKGKLWRVVVSTPGAGAETVDVVPVNGRTVRYDGKPVS